MTVLKKDSLNRIMTISDRICLCFIVCGALEAVLLVGQPLFLHPQNLYNQKLYIAGNKVNIISDLINQFLCQNNIGKENTSPQD